MLSLVRGCLWRTSPSSVCAPYPMTASTASVLVADEDERLLALEVRLGGGDGERIQAAIGFSAMEMIRAAGLPIKAECGGAGVCATCHCRVPEEWLGALPEPANDELDKLDEIPDADDRSRLSCQIQITEALDGLVLELQPDSLDQRLLDAAE